MMFEDWGKVGDVWRRLRVPDLEDPRAFPFAAYVWQNPPKRAQPYDAPTIRWAVGAENGSCETFDAAKEHVDTLLRAKGWL